MPDTKSIFITGLCNAHAMENQIALASHSNDNSAVDAANVSSYLPWRLTEALGQEQAMADWLENNIEAVTLKYAALSESGETAKR